MKKLLIGALTAGSLLGLTALPVFAKPIDPGHYGTANPSAQCGTGAASGAFNAHNEIYGEPGTPGGSDSLNSSYFGLTGGSGGGQTGLNNSSVCGNRQ